MGFAQLVALLGQGRFLDLQLHDMPGNVIQLRGHGIHFRADQGAGLVHQVDGLIRQEPVADVPVGQGGGGDQGIILDLYAMKYLIPLLQAPQDGNGILHRRLLHHDRLEPPGQGRILFNILAVFIQGGGADAVELAPGQHGLQQVACIHAAFSTACPDDVVQLIDKQDDLAFAALHFPQYRLEPFLKFPTEFGAGDQGAHVQGEDPTFL